jgi:hypothetical protein
MNLKFLKLLSGLLLAFCLVAFVSAGAGTANGTDSIVESTPEVVPVTDLYAASEGVADNTTENTTGIGPAVTDEVNFIPIEEDSATDNITEEESEEELSLLSEPESETTEIVIEESDFNWEGEVSLTKGPDFKYSPTNNSAASYDVNATSDLAALLAAGDIGGFDVYTDDKWYSSGGTFWLEGIGDVNSSSDGHYYWSIYVNGESVEYGLSGNILKDGDLLQFAYGYSDWYTVFPTPTNFDNIANITVNIEDYSGMAMLIPSKSLMEDTPYTTQISVANITDASGLSTFLTWNPDVIDILNVTVNSSVFSGSAIYLNLTEGYAEVALTNTDGITATAPAPVFDVEFRSKKGLHQETILLGTGTQYSDRSFINHTLPCEDGIFRIERVKGDFNANGFADIGDVSRVAYMVAGKAPADMEADFNENGRIDVGDAALIAWFFIGKTGYL